MMEDAILWCLITTRTAPGHAHSIAEQILLLLSTTDIRDVLDHCHACMARKGSGQVFLEQDQKKKTITGPLWPTTPLLSNSKARPQSLAKYLREAPSSQSQSVKPRWHGHQKNKQTKPIKNASPSLQSPLCLSKCWKPHHRTPRKKSRGSNHVRVDVDYSIETCFSPSIPMQSIKPMSTHKNGGVTPTTVKFPPLPGQSSRCPHSSSSTESLRHVLCPSFSIFETLLVRQCPGRTLASRSRQTDFTTLPVTSAETNHHNRKKYQIHIHKRTKQKHIFQIDIHNPNGIWHVVRCDPSPKQRRERNQMMWLSQHCSMNHTTVIGKQLAVGNMARTSVTFKKNDLNKHQLWRWQCELKTSNAKRAKLTKRRHMREKEKEKEKEKINENMSERHQREECSWKTSWKKKKKREKIILKMGKEKMTSQDKQWNSFLTEDKNKNHERNHACVTPRTDLY